jgi:hypothetical protein
MSCMFIYMYLGCIKSNVDIDCGILKYFKTFKIFKTFKLLNTCKLILSAAVSCSKYFLILRCFL